MRTKEQFEKTYMHKENVMTYDQYVEMETRTAAILEKHYAQDFDKNFVEAAAYNKANKFTND